MALILKVDAYIGDIQQMELENLEYLTKWRHSSWSKLANIQAVVYWGIIANLAD